MNGSRRITAILFLAALTLTVFSCATRISDMNISRIDVTVRDDQGNMVESLLPGSEYSVDFRVTDSSGKLYKNPNYQDFRIDELSLMRLVQQARFSVKIRTSLESFHGVGTPAYVFRLAVKDNRYPSEVYSFPLDWNEYNTIDFSGDDGDEGEDGKNGYDASGESEDTVQGGSGKNGTDGTKGLSGTDVKLVVMRYLHGDEDKLLFYEPDQDLLFLTDMKTIIIDTSGGDGGSGGSAGDGGRGEDYIDEISGTVVKEGVPGIPGNAGDGGNAGNGGDMVLMAEDPQLFNLIEPRLDGGEGGRAGSPGRQYDTNDEVSGWSGRGRKGRDGRDGDLQYRVLTEFELRSFIDRIDREDFDASSVQY